MVFTQACSTGVVASASVKMVIPRSAYGTPCANQAVLCASLGHHMLFVFPQVVKYKVH
jgi:hypothetical protein